MVNDIMDPKEAHATAISLSQINFYVYSKYLTLYPHIVIALIKDTSFWNRDRSLQKAVTFQNAENH